MDNGQEGTTLVALLIALAISGILLIGLMRLFNTSLKSYKLEEKDLDMQRTAVLVLDRLSEDIQQAGSGMPPEDTGLTINSTGTWIFIRSNGTAVNLRQSAIARQQPQVTAARGRLIPWILITGPVRLSGQEPSSSQLGRYMKAIPMICFFFQTTVSPGKKIPWGIIWE